jgi:glycosyltransferase involved in cell wall biosynthesis
MFNQITVSIIIPAYNVEKYLVKCLDSVVTQTYKSIEIIVVNDGSTDNTPSIVESYSEIDNRIIIIGQENQGLSVARNVGLNASHGDYIYFLDADDFISKSAIENSLDFAEKNKLDIVEGRIVHYYDENHQSPSVGSNWKNEPIILEEISDIYTFFISHRKSTGGTAWNKLIRKEFLIKNNIQFTANLSSIEDVLWFYVSVLPATKRIGFIPSATYYYLQTNTNSITKGYSVKKMQSQLFVVKQIMGTAVLYNWILNVKNPMCNDIIYYAIRQLSMLKINKNLRKKYFFEIKNVVMSSQYSFSKNMRFITKITNYSFKYCNIWINLLLMKCIKLLITTQNHVRKYIHI